MKSILDPTFRYVPSVETDVAKTFARIRREREKAKAAAQSKPVNVQQIRKVKP